MDTNILDWYKHYAKHIDKMYNIYINYLRYMDKYNKYDNDRMYKKFIMYLYNNSPHLLYNLNEHENADVLL